MSEQWARRLSEWKTIHYLNMYIYIAVTMYTFKPTQLYPSAGCIQGDVGRQAILNRKYEEFINRFVYKRILFCIFIPTVGITRQCLYLQLVLYNNNSVQCTYFSRYGWRAGRISRSTAEPRQPPWYNNTSIPNIIYYWAPSTSPPRGENKTRVNIYLLLIFVVRNSRAWKTAILE